MLAALVRRGATELTVLTRSPEHSGELLAVADRLGLALTVGGFDMIPDGGHRSPDVVVSTLPGTARPDREFSRELRSTVPLVDVAYDPWPTAMAAHWRDGGGVVNNGLGMLVHQALAQVRVFVNGDPDHPVHDEEAVLAAMRTAAAGTS
jgi:shikimate dehydrogenase